LQRRTYMLAFIAIMAVLSVFFCHLDEGPWSAVNGPATALQGVRYALLFFLLIALACSVIAASCDIGPMASASAYDNRRTTSQLPPVSTTPISLRC
jgi:hypothetical protein